MTVVAASDVFVLGKDKDSWGRPMVSIKRPIVMFCMEHILRNMLLARGCPGRVAVVIIKPTEPQSTRV